jgi:hypothetical protein
VVKTPLGHADPAAHWRQRLADGLANDRSPPAERIERSETHAGFVM